MYGLTPLDVRTIALQLAKRMNLHNNFNVELQLAGEDWFPIFMERYRQLSLLGTGVSVVPKCVGKIIAF